MHSPDMHGREWHIVQGRIQYAPTVKNKITYGRIAFAPITNRICQITNRIRPITNRICTTIMVGANRIRPVMPCICPMAITVGANRFRPITNRIRPITNRIRPITNRIRLMIMSRANAIRPYGYRFGHRQIISVQLCAVINHLLPNRSTC